MQLVTKSISVAPGNPTHGLSVLGPQKAGSIKMVPALKKNPKQEVVHRTPVNNKTAPLAAKYRRGLLDAIACKRIRQLGK